MHAAISMVLGIKIHEVMNVLGYDSALLAPGACEQIVI